jgi:hypothetical protein
MSHHHERHDGMVLFILKVAVWAFVIWVLVSLYKWMWK